MKNKPSGSTAADLMRDLSNDSDFFRKQQIRENVRHRKTSTLLVAESPLVIALKSVGISVESIWDLVNTKKDYSRAIFVLRDHLRLPYPNEILEGIARALAIPSAISIRSDLINFLNSNVNLNSNLMYAICLAISATTDEDNLQETLNLAGESRLGDARLGLLFSIKKFRKNNLVQNILDKLSNDPVLSVEIKSWK